MKIQDENNKKKEKSRIGWNWNVNVREKIQFVVGISLTTELASERSETFHRPLCCCLDALCILMLICSSRVRNTSMLLSKSSFKQQHNWASDGLLKLNYGWTSCYASRSCNRLSTNRSSLRNAKWWTERSFLHSHTWDIRHRSRVQSSVWEIFRYFWHWAREHEKTMNKFQSDSNSNLETHRLALNESRHYYSINALELFWFYPRMIACNHSIFFKCLTAFLTAIKAQDIMSSWGRSYDSESVSFTFRLDSIMMNFFIHFIRCCSSQFIIKL